jgi:hypothetical protein
VARANDDGGAIGGTAEFIIDRDTRVVAYCTNVDRATKSSPLRVRAAMMPIFDP